MRRSEVGRKKLEYPVRSTQYRVVRASPPLFKRNLGTWETELALRSPVFEGFALRRTIVRRLNSSTGDAGTSMLCCVPSNIQLRVRNISTGYSVLGTQYCVLVPWSPRRAPLSPKSQFRNRSKESPCPV